MVERKKIALCMECPLALRGGVSVLVETLLAGFKERFDLVLVSSDKREELAGQPVAELLSGHVTWKSAAVSPKTSWKLAKELKRQGVALAHFHIGGNYGFGNRFPGYCPIPYLELRGIATCSTVHLVVNPLDGYCGPQKPLWFKLAMLPLAWTGKMHQLWHVRRELAVSHHDEEKLKRWYRPLRKKFGQLYHSRLHQSDMNAAQAPREPIVLNVGHVAWRKGQLVLAEAFVKVAPKYPEWKLWLAGDVLEKNIAEKIMSLARANGLGERISLLGPRTDALDLMRRAGVYVQPSYFEALGLALQEAMFTGCPGVGTRAGGIPELVQHERTGFLVDVGGVDEMAKALDKLMGDPALREEYGRNGETSIIERGMTAEQMTANYVKLYEEILRGR